METSTWNNRYSDAIYENNDNKAENKDMGIQVIQNPNGLGIWKMGNKGNGQLI